jgi:hypothetical protein
MAYKPGPKRVEMFDPLTRFLLLTKSASQSTGHRNAGTSDAEEEGVAMPGAMPPPRRSSRFTAGAGKSKGKARAPLVEANREELLGYCSFRFDTEETMGTKDAEVIYWYVSSHLYS